MGGKVGGPRSGGCCRKGDPIYRADRPERGVEVDGGEVTGLLSVGLTNLVEYPSDGPRHLPDSESDHTSGRGVSQPADGGRSELGRKLKVPLPRDLSRPCHGDRRGEPDVHEEPRNATRRHAGEVAERARPIANRKSTAIQGEDNLPFRGHPCRHGSDGPRSLVGASTATFRLERPPVYKISWSGEIERAHGVLAYAREAVSGAARCLAFTRVSLK